MTQEAALASPSDRRHGSNVHGRSQLFDWLANLDNRARRLPKAEAWWAYDLFLFARYPRLQPGPDQGKRLDIALRAAGYKAQLQLLMHWKGKIASLPASERILRSLGSAKQIQLFALMADIASDFETFERRRNARDWSRSLGREGPRRQIVLLRKLDFARQSLKVLQQYASALDPSLAIEYVEAATEALGRLTELGPIRRLEDLLPLSRELSEIAESPATFAMVQMYWFFRSGCRCTGDESEVRVGLIRNDLWTSFGVSTVDILSEAQTGQSQGCQAVHEAVRRFHALQGTSS